MQIFVKTLTGKYKNQSLQIKIHSIKNKLLQQIKKIPLPLLFLHI